MNPEKGRLIKKIVLLGFTSFLLSLIIFISGILNLFEFKAYDLFSRYLNPVKPQSDIVIVQIDQQSIDALSMDNINWPWPRQVYAPLIDYMSEADAIFMDILFTEPSSYGQKDDIILSESLKKAANVYLPVFLSENKKSITEEDDYFLKKISINEKINAALKFPYALAPISPLKGSVAGSGNVTIPPDRDGVFRKIPLVFQYGRHGEYTIPHFILNYLMHKRIVTIREGRLYSGDTPIPLDNDKRLFLRYYSKEDPFERKSAAEIFKAYLESREAKEPVIKKEYFKGKKVFIGLTAAGLYDLRPTSITSISTGVLIHATAFDNIINRNFMRPVSHAHVIFFMLVISFFITYSVLRYYSFAINLSVFAACFFIALFIPAVLFHYALYMHIIPPALSLIISFIIAVAFSYATEGKERRFVRRAFSQYMDEKIVAYILKNPSIIKPGGQKRYITAFFADIAGFTSLAEKVSPEEIAKILHTILNAFTEVIIQNHGVIDKYIGDAVMAFWGAPLDTEEDEIKACRSALQCIEALEGINASFREQGLSEIAVRIGIHSGDAIAGNLGSDRLFDYTVVGDTINLTSRLESASKVFGTKIIISEDTFKKTGNIFAVRELGLIEVKGKNIPVRIYELIGRNDTIDEAGKIAIDDFNRGISLYHEGKIPDAIKIFIGILKQNQEDGPSLFYKKRCETLMEHPPSSDNWNVIKLTEK